jgi:hypothetical protein
MRLSTVKDPEEESLSSTMIDSTTLIAKLQSSFEKAQNTGDLHFFPSTVVTHNDSEVEVIDIIKLASNVYYRPC